MSGRGEVLVAVINNNQDFNILKEQGWYRIPVTSAEKWMKNCWPPKWLAFYQTKVFGEEAFSVNYFAPVTDIRKVYRWQILPVDDLNAYKRNYIYYQIFTGPLQKLVNQIPSKKFRRIIFIPTTWFKLINASEINDLFDNSNLEDRLWAEFKYLNIPAERQPFIKARNNYYALDFAVYCLAGNLDIETDGDTWHSNPKRAFHDNLRDNALETNGWRVLRFNSLQIEKLTTDYCIPIIMDNIKNLGGYSI
jgi:very-short-patch-repair endonuclease